MSAPDTSRASVRVPETLGYRLKNRLLGRPLSSDRLAHEKLSLPIASGVLSVDCISSSAYGSEQMLAVLIPTVGLAAFTLIIPVTVAILVILAVVTMSYREVVKVYTKAGGSYVVSRDNFGIKTAQIAAVALIVDYTLTVAVQIVAGVQNLASQFAVLNTTDREVILSVAILGIMCFANLRGIREAGRVFAFPTYFYVAAMGTVVVIGIIKGLTGHLHAHALPPATIIVKGHHVANLVEGKIGHSGSGLLLGASVFIFLRALANGGSSLTGLEAVSNGVSAFRAPVAKHARFVLAFIALSLGGLVLGVSLIAHWTHPGAFASGAPTVVHQEVGFVLGTHGFGNVFGYVLTFATSIILLTGGNTSFNGFPYLVSFVAEDGFLPRWLSRRGHRLVYSSGILVLTTVALVLIVATKGNLGRLISLYAIGVFTGFTMAGAGLVKHHFHHRNKGWHRRILINGSAAVLSAVVVLVFAVTKFTEGAFVVVIIGPLLVFFLIRLHNQYNIEAEELEEGAPRVAEVPAMRRHAVLVMVDHLDLAVLRALRYGRTLSPDDMCAVHFAIDPVHAHALADSWRHLQLTGTPLEVVECPDRRLARAATDYAASLAKDGETQVTVLLPRRAFERGWSRVLHDRTADRIAEGISQLPHVSATIIPFHLGRRALDRSHQRRRRIILDRPGTGRAREAEVGATGEAPPAGNGTTGTIGEPSGAAGQPSRVAQRRTAGGASRSGLRPLPPDQGAEPFGDLASVLPEVVPIGDVRYRQMVTVAGRVRSVSVQPAAGVNNLVCMFGDRTGSLPLVFIGRVEVAGIAPGAKLVARGRVCEHHGRLSLLNPEYEFLVATPPVAPSRSP